MRHSQHYLFFFFFTVSHILLFLKKDTSITDHGTFGAKFCAIIPKATLTYPEVNFNEQSPKCQPVLLGLSRPLMKILVFVGAWHWKGFPNVRGKTTLGNQSDTSKNSTNRDWKSTIKIMCE